MIKLIKMMNDDVLKKLRYAEENLSRSYSLENVQILSPIKKTYS
ncbi:hypothetical protein OGZ02_16535 [Brachyspira hyodysenteriae]|nr:hypothetical protein [Brachyspira hyodysenteriae]MDA1470365.1 hypothetical protein [Brachyspira hyodysenteriae]